MLRKIIFFSKIALFIIVGLQQNSHACASYLFRLVTNQFNLLSGIVPKFSYQVTLYDIIETRSDCVLAIFRLSLYQSTL